MGVEGVCCGRDPGGQLLYRKYAAVCSSIIYAVQKMNLDLTEASNKDDDTRIFENGLCTVIIGVKEFAMMTYRLGASSKETLNDLEGRKS